MCAQLTSVALLFLVGCGAGPTPPVSGEPNDGDPQGTWQLVEGAVGGQLVPVLDDHRITLTIEGSSMGGTAACNTYGGQLIVEGGRLRIDELIQTMMGCEEPAMGAEVLFMRGLGSMDSMSLEGEDLLIRGPQIELRFAEVAAPMDSERPGG